MAVTLLAGSLGASGCYYEFRHEDTTVEHVVRERRVVTNGLVPGFHWSRRGPHLGVTSFATQLCRQAELGDSITRSTVTYSRINFWYWLPPVLLLTGGPTAAALGAAKHDGTAQWLGLAAAATGLAWAIVNWSLPRKLTSTKVVGTKPMERWAATRRPPCEPRKTVPLPGRDIRVTATFGPRFIYWSGKTNAQANVEFSVDRRIAAVAAYCGPAQVKVADLTPAPRVSPIDTPTRPVTTLRPGLASMTYEIAPGPRVPLPRIHAGVERDVAGACLAEQRQRCLAGVNVAPLRTSCEEACSGKVDAVDCLTARRNCLAQVEEAVDTQLCANGYRGCLLKLGIQPENLDRCTDRCVSERRQEACP